MTMTLLRGYSKTTDLGTEDCIIVPARQPYQRLSTLPSGWTRCRVGMFFSLIGLGGDNADCTAESVPWINVLDDISFGISNGAGAPGQAGVRYVGISRVPTTWGSSWSSSPDPGYWIPLGGASIAQGMISDGTSQVRASLGNYYYAQHRAPSGGTMFAGFIAVDIALAATTAVIKATNTTSSNYGNTDVSLSALRRSMIDASYMLTTVTGGWWNGSPIGCQHVFVRLPYSSNRLRIHALDVQNLS